MLTVVSKIADHAQPGKYVKSASVVCACVIGYDAPRHFCNMPRNPKYVDPN